MRDISFQVSYESLFAGTDGVFNEELLHQSSCNKFLNAKKISNHSWRELFFDEIGLKVVIIHGITSFLSHASHDPRSAPFQRKIRSAKWVANLAKRLEYLHSKKEFDNDIFNFKKISSGPIEVSHNLIQMLVYSEIIEEVVNERKSVDGFNIIFDTDDSFNGQKRYQLNEELQTFVSNYEIDGFLLGKLPSPLTSPMTEPPQSHRKINGNLRGGYANHLFQHSISDKMLSGVLVKGDETKNIKEITNAEFCRTSALKFESDSKSLKSINHLQRVQWIYNDKLIQLLEKFERPINLDEIGKNKEIEKEITLMNAKNHNNLLKYFNMTAFYYPWFFDYRGRVYCSTVMLNPQADDLSRSLLMFHTSQKVKNEQILFDYVKDSLKIDEDISTAKIKDSINNFNVFLTEVLNQSIKIEFSILESKFLEFLGSLGINNRSSYFSKELYRILAFILEFKHYWDTEGEWRIPIHLDATCNGQQHISALMKNTKIAELTNLFKSEKQMDLYEHIAKKLRENLSKSSALEQTKEERILKSISRRTMKGPIMKMGYGAKLLTIEKNLLDDETFLPLSFWSNEECSDEEKEKQFKDFNRLPLNPTKNQKRENYFYVPKWAAYDKKKKQKTEYNSFKLRGFYPVSSYNPTKNGIILKPSDKEIEDQFNTQILNYQRSLEAQESKILNDVKYEKRKGTIKLIAGKFENIVLEELVLSNIKESLEKLYSDFIENNPQDSENPKKWFSYSSKPVGMTVSFVMYMKAKNKEKGKNGIRTFRTNNILWTTKLKYEPRINIRAYETKIAHSTKIKPKILPSFIHSLDASHLHLIVDQWHSENPGIGPIVTIHDSFGMHPNDVEKFREIARNTFIQLHKENPLLSFFEQCGIEKPIISPTPGFDLERVDSSMFTF